MENGDSNRNFRLTAPISKLLRVAMETLPRALQAGIDGPGELSGQLD